MFSWLGWHIVDRSSIGMDRLRIIVASSSMRYVWNEKKKKIEVEIFLDLEFRA